MCIIMKTVVRRKSKKYKGGVGYNEDVWEDATKEQLNFLIKIKIIRKNILY